MRWFIILILLAAVVSGCEKVDSRCSLAPEGGPCKANFVRYYYDGESCAEFVYGGCRGVVPFETLEECKKACE